MHKFIQLGKRWLNIITGKSSVAVDQLLGKCYSKTKIHGYYNDLTGKVTSATLLDGNGIPVNITSKGETVYSLVTIMQYALGCYDLYLINHDDAYLNRFFVLADYLVDKQESNGKWDARASIGSCKGNSSCMAQGQGCSILLRAAVETNDSRYVRAAEKAIAFMLTSVDEGGTAAYCDEELSFEKYPPQEGKCSSVLNGWAFALFGLHDYILYSGSNSHRQIWERTCKTLEKRLPMYDRGYWSNYDLAGTISSPAYHLIHIHLLSALADLSGSTTMAYYAERYTIYEKSKVNHIRAIAVKLFQKFTQPADAFFVQ